MSTECPPFLDSPPATEQVTDYDLRHRITYLRLLDANAAGACWREVVRILFGLDPEKDADHARRVYNSHLERALWMMRVGYRDLLNLDE